MADTGPRVAVAGAGSIGVGWAIVFSRAGHEVALHDPDRGRLSDSAGDLAARLLALAEHDLLDEQPDVIAARVGLEPTLEAALDGAVHVQECAPESLELKRELFTRMDAIAPMTTTLASSSSMLAPSRFAGDLRGRSRVLVAHPGNPPYLLPVVELVGAPFTASGTIDAVAALLEGAGLSPVRVEREPVGFVFNRLQGAVLREAYCLVRDGVIDVDGVDRVMRDGLGRRWSVMGPFETADLNSRGGIATHARRMGPGYAEMGRERGQDDPWTEELIGKVVAQRRSLLPLEAWEDRVLWRDRALMILERCRRRLDGWPAHDPAPSDEHSPQS
jgi:L-gulonate 3-dehydrogenase